MIQGFVSDGLYLMVKCLYLCNLVTCKWYLIIKKCEMSCVGKTRDNVFYYCFYYCLFKINSLLVIFFVKEGSVHKEMISSNHSTTPI